MANSESVQINDNIEVLKLMTSIKEQDHDAIKKILANGIPIEAINSVYAETRFDSPEFKYLMAIQIMDFCSASSQNESKKLLKYLGGVFKFEFKITFDESSCPCEDTDTDRFVNAESIALEYFDSEEFTIYCDNILKMLLIENHSPQLQYPALLIACHLLDPNNVKFLCPYYGEKITVKHVASAIFEMIDIYYVLISELFEIMSINKSVKITGEIYWEFDNPNHPIEKEIVHHISKNEIASSSNHVSIDMEIYHNLVANVFPIKEILSDMTYYFPIDDLRGTVEKIIPKNVNYSVTKEQIILFCVYQFLISQPLSQYITC